MTLSPPSSAEFGRTTSVVLTALVRAIAELSRCDHRDQSAAERNSSVLELVAVGCSARGGKLDRKMCHDQWSGASGCLTTSAQQKEINRWQFGLPPKWFRSLAKRRTQPPVSGHSTGWGGPCAVKRMSWPSGDQSVERMFQSDGGPGMVSLLEGALRLTRSSRDNWLA